MYIYYHIIYIYIYIIYVWSVLLFNNVSHGLASGTHQTGVRFGPAAQSPCVGGLPAKFHQVQTLRKLCNVLSRALEKKFFSLYIYHTLAFHNRTFILLTMVQCSSPSRSPLSCAQLKGSRCGCWAGKKIPYRKPNSNKSDKCDCHKYDKSLT